MDGPSDVGQMRAQKRPHPEEEEEEEREEVRSGFFTHYCANTYNLEFQDNLKQIS